MHTERRVRFFRNGRNQAVRIPREFEMDAQEAIMPEICAHSRGGSQCLEALLDPENQGVQVFSDRAYR